MQKSWSLAAALIPNLLQLAHLWAAFCYSLDVKAVTLHVPLCLTGNHNILCFHYFQVYMHHLLSGSLQVVQSNQVAVQASRMGLNMSMCISMGRDHKCACLLAGWHAA